MGSNPDALARTETHLRVLARGDGGPTLDRWREACRELAHAPVSDPADIQRWLRTQPVLAANAVLRQLVRCAQAGDGVAVLVVILCLGPGIRTLAARTGITVDEALSEVAMGILDYPVERRSSVAGGLLLDARNRLHRSHLRSCRTEPLDESALKVASQPAGGTGNDGASPPAQRVVQLVCDAHRDGVINHTDAQLILHTRIGGDRVQPVASRLGLSASAAYQRRSRAEARLARHVA